MKIGTHSWNAASGWTTGGEALSKARLVLYFAAPKAAGPADPYGHLRRLYPEAHIVGATTGGEILGEEVQDDSVAAVAVAFESTGIGVTGADIAGPEKSADVGRELASRLTIEGLRAVFVLADGILTNGSALIEGMRGVLGETVILTGGLAGDGADFKETRVGCDGPPESGRVAAVGFYGDALKIGWGSFGGWDRFGPERIITRAKANVLYELDGEPALDLYKRYLGDEAAKLPGSALLFPLTVRPRDQEMSAVVRTIVGVSEADRSMTFAGDVPEGYVAQLMRGHFDGLVEGASRAGQAASQDGGAVLALLVSCIGRKLLMGQRIADEAEAVAEALGPKAVPIGFYSYGEIAPHGFTGRCELHNQTMTVTTFAED